MVLQSCVRRSGGCMVVLVVWFLAWLEVEGPYCCMYDTRAPMVSDRRITKLNSVRLRPDLQYGHHHYTAHFKGARPCVNNDTATILSHRAIPNGV